MSEAVYFGEIVSTKPGGDMLIWWTNQDDCKAVGSKSKWPKYLKEQFSDRLGRNGRGRLWVAEQFGTVGIDPWPDTPLARAIGDRYAGIVIRREDAPLLTKQPGIVTDFDLSRA